MGFCHNNMAKRYQLDKQGFVVVNFVSPSVLPRKPDKSTKKTIPNDKIKKEVVKKDVKKEVVKKVKKEDVKILDTQIDPTFKDLADKGDLTKDYLLNMEFTNLLKSATYPPSQKQVLDILGIRGVHLLEKTPKGDDIKLFPHQIKTLAWMREREALSPYYTNGLVGGIVSLKMGLGKTLVALVHILSRPKGEFPSLVIASKTVMHEWKSQGIEKFFGKQVKVLYLHKDFIPKSSFDSLKRKDIMKYDLVISTYDVCVQACKNKNYVEECLEYGDEHTLMNGKVVGVHCRTRSQADLPNEKGAGLLYGTPWDLVICDESQRYANPKTKIFRCIMALYGKNKWCLTGTIFRNYDTDVWSQLAFCGYTGVKQAIEWKRCGLRKMQEHKLNDAIFKMEYESTTIVLPPKTENFHFVNLEGKQKIYYDWLLGQTIDAYDDMMRGVCSFACVLALFTRLRQSAIAPYLTTSESKRKKKVLTKGEKEAEERIKQDFQNSEMFKWLHDKKGDAGIASSKIQEILKTITSLPKGEKVVIFSTFTSCLDLVAEALRVYFPDYNYIQVDGDVVGNERSELIDQFRSEASISAMLMSYKVGSEGLTLVEANHCICIEPWWTNAVHNQAKARVWRPGQTKEVFLHNILVRDSIEDRIMDICKDKDELSDAFLEGTEKPLKKRGGLNKYTLGKILGK